jgi:N,N'-diacetyllegionaminate synthase
MATGVKITENRGLGRDNPCFIIAEAGSNHNGDLEIAKQLIDTAAEARADAVKFQIFKAEGLYSKYTPGFSYLQGQDTYQLIKDLETPREWIGELADHCRHRGIIFMASPFDFEAVDLLDPYVPAHKVASFEIVDLELIKHIASKGKPIIISTGMSRLGEIEDAVEAARSQGNDQVALLHCNSLYPTPPEAVNLRAMRTMGKAFHLPVGFSDHTLGIHVPVAAVALGACVIEKHFTMSRKMKGPDHAFALEPQDLTAMVTAIREVEKAMGNGIKEKSALECEEMYEKARRSIHAKVDIPGGRTIARDMLTIKRPGYGIKPKFIDIVAGRTAKKDIRADEWITWDMV